MPQFDLADEDIKALRVFLASRTDGKVPAKCGLPAASRTRWSSTARGSSRATTAPGCHVIEGSGGDIRRLYEETPTLAPPILNGEGEKVQADWLFSFLKAPIADPPVAEGAHAHLRSRRPRGATPSVGYFRARASVDDPVRPRRSGGTQPPTCVEAGKLLTSKDYFDCFSCHQRGDNKPQGPPEGWAPDLALAAQAAEPGVDRQVAPRPAEGDAGHEDAVVLPGRAARRPRRRRRARRCRRCATTSCRSGCPRRPRKPTQAVGGSRPTSPCTKEGNDAEVPVRCRHSLSRSAPRAPAGRSPTRRWRSPTAARSRAR